MKIPNQKKSNNRLILILSVLVGLLLLFAIIGKSLGWVGKQKMFEVDMAKVSFETIVEKVSASGMVRPVIEVKISPEVAGEIIELQIKEGDSVKTGDLLLKIRPDNFISSLNRSKANLNQQKANLAASKANLARSEAGFYRSQLEFNRQSLLHKEEMISDAEYELAEANYKIATQDLESAKQMVEAGVHIVKSSQATVDEAKENLMLTNIQAPMTGIVSKLDVEKGETVVGTIQMQGTEMLRIADLTNMEVRVDVNENDIIKISIGDTALIDVDSYSYLKKEFKGVVTQIANSANNKVSSDAVTEFEVRIHILNDSYQDLLEEMNIIYPFRPGMTASVEIITMIKDNILTVPLSAVTTRKETKKGSVESQDEAEEASDDKSSQDQEENIESESEVLEEIVFVHLEGKVKKVKVQTGISDFENIEIISGLSADDEIVTGPFLLVSKRLKDKSAVVLREKNLKDQNEDEENAND
ncbi:MAG: efflux transporter periplasmic adaptor subunit [Flammeovirgaceae bacterium]|nr:efflux transporter periplasmic adaptor subunit [Flammeovirgaceae bacterium]|tara:strand:- start:4389 stop:5804 length:1416 start_codon:yes stop_codon:yes gene_type:complete